jgi:D-alanyl-D-alanine carboxypeptidase
MRVNFIAEMNRAARSIDLKSTVYRSSFGDGGTEQDRTTTARDLSRLAWKAMQMSAFRRHVATLRHEAEVRRPDGTTRRAVWENTNKLLALDLGYDGI